MEQNQLAVFAAPLPFSDKQVKLYAAPGSTIQEIIDLMNIDRFGDAVGIVVEISGHRVYREHWKTTRPKLNTITTVNVVPLGGGGKKNPLAAILSIAILVAAPYAVAGMGFSSLGLAANSLTLAGRALAAGIGMIGNMIVNALAPPPTPSNSGQTSNPAESPTQFIEGASNRLDPYGVIPICLGTNRIFPTLAAKTFTETVDNDQFSRQMFVWSYGPVFLENYKIGDTDIEQFNNLELEHRLNGDLSAGVSLYANDTSQDDYNVLLEQVTGYVIRTTAPDTDEALVDVTFPNGLSKYNDKGTRVSQNVKLDISYAPTGVSPQVWSPGASTFTAKTGATLVPAGAEPYTLQSGGTFTNYRRDVAVVNNITGAITLVKGTGYATNPVSAATPTVPANSIRLATILVKVTRLINNPTVTKTIETMSDDRDVSQYGVTLQDSASFAPTVVGSNLQIASGGLSSNPLDITAAQSEALRRTVTIRFPSRGQYDIRIRRITADVVSDKIFDKVFLSAVRSITYRNPWILTDTSGSAMRIKATDQLNGVVDQFNAVCSTLIPDYDVGTDTWIVRKTSNPASIYRYILQGPANKRPLTDAQISIEDLEAWHIQCDAKGYSYNRVIDYETSVAAVLSDVASAGRAAPNIVDGKRTIVVDLEKSDIVQVITPRNSWSYSATITYPKIPHALRVAFRNPAVGYQQDETIVYDDGYSEDGTVPGTVTATIYEGLELLSCTDPDLAYRLGRTYFATAKLRPEKHTFMQDVENLVALRGQRIKFASDIPQVGTGDGRIKSLTLGGSSPQTITGIVLDDTIAIPTVGDFYVRIRKSDGSQIYTSIITSVGNTQTLVFRTPVLLINGPEVGDLAYVVQAGKELDLIITRIEPQQDLSAKITAENYAPEIFNANSDPIPPFLTNITTPLSLIRPEPPVLLTIQSDEQAMVRNSDGSITSRLIIGLQNDNPNDVSTTVSIRQSGATVWGPANVLEATPERVILTGLDDNVNYDIAIRYRRGGAVAVSLPLLINSYKFIGAGSAPSDVTGFVITIVNDQANLAWNPSPDIDHSHWKIKFSSLIVGANWETAQILDDTILANRLTTALQSGTYLIKAVDIAGNESTNAALIETGSFGTLRNVVQTYNEEPTFAGVKVDTAVQSGTLILADPDIAVGYYYFANTLDLGDVYTSFLSAAITANGAFINNLYDYADLFLVPDLFGSGSFNLFDSPDLFAEPDLFGIGTGAWTVELQFRTTEMSTGGSPVTWTAWSPFQAGALTFRGIQFRAVLTSLQPGITPQVTGLQVTIDMPDRVIAEDNISVGVLGLYVPFTPPFLQLDGLAIAAQELQPGDVVFIDPLQKDENGFFIQFFNSVGGAVVRSFDYVAKGFGIAIP